MRFPLAEQWLRQPRGTNYSGLFERALDTEVEKVNWDDDPEDNKSKEADSTKSSTEESVAKDNETDFWTVTPDRLVRHHREPRRTPYVPESHDFPIQMRFLDAVRITYTNLPSQAETAVEDYSTEDPIIEYSDDWTGSTVFEILRPKPPKGKK